MTDKEFVEYVDTDSRTIERWPKEAFDPFVKIDKIAAALAKAQGMMRGAIKDSKNPFFKSKYAGLDSVWDACREALAANEIAVLQWTSEDGGAVHLHMQLVHSSGQSLPQTPASYPVKPMKQDPQGMGSALTYARRYLLETVVGIAREDDDGEAAMARRPAAEPITAEHEVPLTADLVESLVTTAKTREALANAVKQLKSNRKLFDDKTYARLGALCNEKKGTVK